MEIHFELTHEDVQTLIDETVDVRVKRNDTDFTALVDWQGRYLSKLLIGLSLTGAALSPWLLLLLDDDAPALPTPPKPPPPMLTGSTYITCARVPIGWTNEMSVKGLGSIGVSLSLYRKVPT